MELVVEVAEMTEPSGNVCTTREAAEMLGVSLKTVQLWVDNGILEAWKTAGGHRRVSIDSVRRIKEGRYPDFVKAQDSSRNKEVLLAYQPILDVECRLLGYELLYRQGEHSYTNTRDPISATSKVIAVAFGELGVISAMGDSTCFINIEEQMLFDDMLLTLPPGRVVLELPAATIPSDAVVNRCRFLRSMGYELLLENFQFGESPERLLPHVKFVKVDCRDLERLADGSAFQLPLDVDLIACRVETEDAFRLAREVGAKYYQGFYFAHPKILMGAKVSPQRATILAVLAMIISDADLIEIERRLKLEPSVCYSLLRLVNSIAFYTGRRIESLREALILLGRKNLQRWFQILLFAHEEDPQHYPSALLLAAALRGRLLEYLAVLLPGKSISPEKAFMVGILSYIEALMHVPLYEVLLSLPLSADVEAALMTREGALGNLLTIAEALDQGDFSKAQATAEVLGVLPEHLRGGLVESMRFSSVLAYS